MAQRRLNGKSSVKLARVPNRLFRNSWECCHSQHHTYGQNCCRSMVTRCVVVGVLISSIARFCEEWRIVRIPHRRFTIENHMNARSRPTFATGCSKFSSLLVSRRGLQLTTGRGQLTLKLPSIPPAPSKPKAPKSSHGAHTKLEFRKIELEGF